MFGNTLISRKFLLIYGAAATAAVAAFAFALFALVQELAVFDHLGKTSSERFQQVLAGRRSIGLSSYSKKLALDDCYGGTGFLQTAARSDAQNREFATQCLTIAQDILKAAPTQSYAWLIAATAEQRLGRIEGMNQALVNGQRTGPAESWLAERRMGIAQDAFSDLDSRARQANDLDLAMLLNTWKGRKALARRFAADPPFRDRIAKLALSQPAYAQKEFLYAVTNVVNGTEDAQ